MSSTVLADRDVNATVQQEQIAHKGDVKSMEYHRKVLQSSLNEEKAKQTYVSPSDNIMSPCTAKLSALRSKHAIKAKPKSLFAQASTKRLGLFVDKPEDLSPEKKVDGQ